MAMKAGRVGVAPTEVTPSGKIKDTSTPYELPVATSSTLGGVKPVAKTEDMTQDVGVDSSGKLYVEPAEVPTGGGTIYYKDFAVNTSAGSGTMMHSSDVSIVGYIPISVKVKNNRTQETYSGVVGLYETTTGIVAGMYENDSYSTYTARVYYVPSDNVEEIPTT